MKSTNLIGFVSLCSIFCLMLFVQSANAQSDRTPQADPSTDTDPAQDEEVVPNDTPFGAAPGGAGVASRDQKLKDSIHAAIQAYNLEQKNFGFKPLCSDAELQKMLSGDFVTKFKGFLAGHSAMPHTTTITAAAPTVEIKNNGPGYVTLGFADGSSVQIVPKDSRTFPGTFGNVRLSSDSDWANIEILGQHSEFSFMDGDDQKTYDLKPGQPFKRELQMGKKHYVLQPK